MKITKVTVANYRNIDGIVVDFNNGCSYLIGENNLGKSNFLSLLDTVCNGWSFNDKDFSDSAQPIEVNIEISLLSNELGFFGDNFLPEDATMIKINYKQAITDSLPTILCVESNESISPKIIKKLNFLKFETTASPAKELRIDTQKGAGLLISGIIDKFITTDEIGQAFTNDEQVNRLKNYINNHLSKIRSFKDYSIKATIAQDAKEMLTSLFFLSDSERKIDSTGSGVQYMAMASINILCQITEIHQSKSIPFIERLYTRDDGKNILPLILSIDEPEVHLHPYLQRSLISYYKHILQNKDTEFVELLKMCFDIDGIDGQLIIVTHSTDALIGDYRNLVRFYKAENKVCVVSGAKLNIRNEAEKHLIMKFNEIKEAFYAKCAIIVEGQTEYGCIHSFAQKLGIDLDELGICAINAQGADSIEPIKKLLAEFAISSVAIYDNDKRPATVNVNCFYTTKPCFEIELVDKLCTENRKELIRSIAKARQKTFYEAELTKDLIAKHKEKTGMNATSYSPQKLSEINDDDASFAQFCSTWLLSQKGVLLGRIVGEEVPSNLIPECYANAIRKAKEIANAC